MVILRRLVLGLAVLSGLFAASGCGSMPTTASGRPLKIVRMDRPLGPPTFVFRPADE